MLCLRLNMQVNITPCLSDFRKVTGTFLNTIFSWILALRQDMQILLLKENNFARTFAAIIYLHVTYFSRIQQNFLYHLAQYIYRHVDLQFVA